MKIANRLRFSSGILLAAILCVGGGAVASMVRTARTLSSTLSRSFQAINAMERLAELAREYNLAAAGHAGAAGAEDDTAELDRIEADLEAALVRLEGLDAESGQTARTAVQEDIGSSRGLLHDLSSSAQGSQGAVGGFGQLAGQRVLRELHERVTGSLAELRDAQQVRLDHLVASTSRQAWLLTALLAVLALAGGGAGLALFAGFRSGVLRPLQALADDARRVSAGRDLTVAVAASGDDEVQEVGRAFAEMIASLRGITVEARAATDRLLASATALGGITSAQGETVSRQAGALEEVRRTSLALRESSRATADQAEGVLQVAQRAEELGRVGEVTVTEGLASSEAALQQTHQAAERIGRLATSARRIAAIIAAVKDLASQSNVLALNAAIAAARAGAAGAGFGVVATEMRSLADRSIRATGEVNAVLTEVLAGIGESVALVESASGSVEEGTSRTRRLGDSAAELSQIVRQNLGAVREIAGAIASQGSGIAQISTAVEDMGQAMDQTLTSVRSTGEAAGVVREVSEQVSSAVKAFQL